MQLERVTALKARRMVKRCMKAKTHFSRLIDAAHAGETIVIAKGGRPWARLFPWRSPSPGGSPVWLKGRPTPTRAGGVAGSAP